MAEERLPEFLREISDDLERTMNFWLKHSHDDKYGGFFNCLGPTGEVYGETKHVWLQGRQAWMYARLLNDLEAYRKPEILDAAKKGAEFVQEHAKNPSTLKLCLSMTRDGRPIKIQKTMFSESFYIMAMSELARATQEQKYRDEAIQMMDKVVNWVREDWSPLRLGAPSLPGESNLDPLNVPMILLSLVDQMETMDAIMGIKYSDQAEWCVEQILKHIQREGAVILENISNDGKEVPGCDGRLMNPGHAIEAGWFLLQYAIKKGREDLKKIAIEKFMINPFEYGWDKQHGGLFYFLDADGISPTQLEWNLKLWWPHNEALIAFLMAYKETRDPKLLEKFATVFDYCYDKHVDRKNGEWTGYLNRDGSTSMDFKGGPWKGCFHVPRALLMCKQMLEEIINQ